MAMVRTAQAHAHDGHLPDRRQHEDGEDRAAQDQVVHLQVTDCPSCAGAAGPCTSRMAGPLLTWLGGPPSHLCDCAIEVAMATITHTVWNTAAAGELVSRWPHKVC